MGDSNSGIAQDLIESLQDENKPQKGVPDDYLDSLDRVNVNSLEDDDDCPICTNKFKNDKYPLIVKLPCNAKTKHRGHIFDLECIGPWLKLNSTCPLCRFDLLEVNERRRKRLEEELKEVEEEEEWDDYA